MDISVIICTHNPRREHLQRTLGALRAQTLPSTQWETIVVDNNSAPQKRPQWETEEAATNMRMVEETQLGLNAARRRGITEASGELLVLVDDDNLLAPDYLARAQAIFHTQVDLGAAGGPISAEFAYPPPDWLSEFHSLLALRDLGPEVITSRLDHMISNGEFRYPNHAPVGAGMILRRSVAQQWITQSRESGLSDRRGDELSSSGDNDIVWSALNSGFIVGYFPDLRLRHLIPAERLDPAYLARLNHGIQCSWVQLLARHQACPWPAISPITLPLRQARAWWRRRAWRGPAEHIRWRGDCGRFAGQSRLSSTAKA